MSRSRPRTSRVLIGVLGLTVAIGALTFAIKYRHISSAQAAPTNSPASLSRAPQHDPDDGAGPD